MNNPQKILDEGTHLANVLVDYGMKRGMCPCEVISDLAVAECILARALDSGSGRAYSSRLATSEGHALFRLTQHTTFEN